MEYEDITEMVIAILAYVKEYPGRVIVSDDVPADLRYGFTLKDVDPFLLNRPTWRISCKNFRSSASKLSDKACEIMTEYFQLAYKRQLFANLLTNGMKPPEMSATP